MDGISAGLEYLHSRTPPVVHGDLRGVRAPSSSPFDPEGAHFVFTAKYPSLFERCCPNNRLWASSVSAQCTTLFIVLSSGHINKVGFQCPPLGLVTYA